MYDCYSYHCSKHIVRPDDAKLDKNIKGLELEISDYDCEDNLENLIYDGYITCPENEDEIADEHRNIAIEYDGSVAWELIFKADTIRPLMSRVKDINQELNPKTVVNSRGTSAHIHLNRQYLYNQGINTLDMLKAGEWTGFPAYLISGRNREKMENWCRSTLPCNIDENLLTKSKLVDRLNDISYNRYNMMNFNNSNTIEYRLFSNYCNFDYKTIKMYMEYTDMISKLAELMHNKSYQDEFETAVEFVDEFMTKYPRRRKFYEKYNMDSIFVTREELLHIQQVELFERVEDRIKRFERMRENQTYDNNVLSFIRAVRDVNQELFEFEPLDINVNPSNMDFESLTEELRENSRRILNL